MMREKGKGHASVIPEASLSDRISAVSSNPRLDRVTQGRIGDQLRAMYDDLMQQPVPDKFRDLLTQLGKKDGDSDR